MRFLDDTELWSIVAVGICFIVCGGYAFFVYLIFTKVMFVPNEVLEDEGYKNRWGSLYDSFRLDNRWTKCFLLFQKARRTMFVVFLVALA